MGKDFHMLCQRYSGSLIPTVSAATPALGTLYFHEKFSWNLCQLLTLSR